MKAAFALKINFLFLLFQMHVTTQPSSSLWCLFLDAQSDI